jgi:hypothetical protein
LKFKKQRLTREGTLKAKPIRNQAVGETSGYKGELILTVPVRKDRWLRIVSRILYIPGERKISLDEIGVWVWRKCDGKANVGEMIEALAGEFKVNSKEAEVSLLGFLKKLADKRLIGFLINT